MFPFAQIAGGIAGIGLGSAITNGISALFGNHQQKQNLKMMREQMAFQTSEREASQAYQTSEREAQQAYQTGERNAQNIWQESMYGKYQSPDAMVRQYNEAGINGKLAASGQAGMGNMSVSGGSNGGAPSSGAPSGHSVSAPYQNINAWSAGFSDMAGSLKSLGEAKKLGIETKYYEDEIKQRLAQSKIKTSIDSLDFDIKKLYAKPMAKAALDKLLVEIEKENMDIKVIIKQLDILTSEDIIKKARADSIIEQIRLELNKLSEEIEESKTRQGLNKAQENVANKEAGLYPQKSKLLHEQAGYYAQQRQKLVSDMFTQDAYRTFLSTQTKIYDLDAEIKDATKDQQKQLVNKQIDLLTKQIDLCEQHIKKAKNENNYFLVNELRGITRDISYSIYVLSQVKSGKLPTAVSDLMPPSSIGIPYN